MLHNWKGWVASALFIGLFLSLPHPTDAQQGHFIPSYTFSTLPTPGFANRLARVTDTTRGVWIDNGTTWSRVSPFVLASDFGMSTSATSAANKTALLAALSAADASTQYKTVLIEGGTYAIDPPIIIPGKNLALQGVGDGFSYDSTVSGTGALPATVLKYTTGKYGIGMDFATAKAFTLKNIKIDCNSVLQYGVRVSGGMNVSHVTATNCTGAGFRVQAGNAAFMDRISGVSNGGRGISIDVFDTTDTATFPTQAETTSFSVTRSVFRTNTGIGFYMEEGQNVHIRNVTCEGNQAEGMKLFSPTGGPTFGNVDLEDVWLESNYNLTDAVNYQLVIDNGTPAVGSNPSYLMFTNLRANPGGTTRRSININSGAWITFVNFSGPGVPDPQVLMGPNASYVVWIDRGGGGTLTGGSRSFEWIRRTSGVGGWDLINISGSALNSSNGFYERLRNTALGEWTTPTFAAGDFTASGTMTWTVAAGNLLTDAYTLVGKTMIYSFHIVTTSTAGAAATTLQRAIPGGFVAAKRARNPVDVFNGGVHTVGMARVLNGGTVIQIFKDFTQGTNYTSPDADTEMYGQLTFEVQ